jgi:hypothetical protein
VKSPASLLLGVAVAGFLAFVVMGGIHTAAPANSHALTQMGVPPTTNPGSYLVAPIPQVNGCVSPSLMALPTGPATIGQPLTLSVTLFYPLGTFGLLNCVQVQSYTFSGPLVPGGHVSSPLSFVQLNTAAHGPGVFPTFVQALVFVGGQSETLSAVANVQVI